MVLECIPHTDNIIGYKWNILQSLQKLLICRDAYWKIAGEEMNLGKPWQPDWVSLLQIKYCIDNVCGLVDNKEIKCNYSCILAFPIDEMRNAFYENFKELIEQCKEFL